MITSYGIILYTIAKNKKVFLIGKRMDSLEYLDMFNTRCPIEKVEMYVYKCTPWEKEKLRADNFEDIYDDSFAGHRNYNELWTRWQKIRSVVMKALKNGQSLPTSCMYSLPKGKKKYGETQENAALREFEEETRIDVSRIQKVESMSHVHIFRGSDDKQYKTIYYVYKIDSPIEIQQENRRSPYEHRKKCVSAEMEYMLWVDIDEAPEYLSSDIVDILKKV